MSHYPLGQEVEIFRTFLADGTPVDPATVTLQIERPDGTLDEYEFGVDAELTNPSTGYYELDYLPPAPGAYNYVWNSTDPTTAGPGGFTVGASATATTIPLQGPCEPWTTAEDVAACCADFEEASDASALDEWAALASEVLFHASGEEFPGECAQITVRPRADGCRCGGTWGAGWTVDPTRWVNGAGICGCDATDEVRLAGYPIRSIVSVKIDGDTLATTEYELHGNKLMRLRDADGKRQYWPSCQKQDLADTEEGTFSITYTYGAEPPLSGRRAAAELACQMYSACVGSGEDCALPENVRRTVRAGLTMEHVPVTASALLAGETGMFFVDVFLARHGRSEPVRRSAVFSPDRSWPRVQGV